MCANKRLTYCEWGDYILGADNVYSEDNCRKGFYIVSKLLNRLDNNLNITSDSVRSDIENLKFELIKERKKLQTINLEYHKNARSEGRYELFLENIENAIKNLKPIEIKPTVYHENISINTTGVLFLSDAHYGRYCNMNGLFGEVINSYSVKEFETRMWNLLSQIDNDIYDIKMDKLDIIDCGDNIEGILRVGDSLRNLETGVIDSAIAYAEFIAVWLVELHNRLQIPITYSLTGGNHDVIRILQSKPDFQEENIAKFIYKHINDRITISKQKCEIEALKNNKKFYPINISLNPYNDVLYQNYYGINVLAYHGDTKNMKEDIDFFENYYQIDIDILVGGHLHRNSSETVGIGYMGDREILRLPSICGMDTFSKKIRKSSRAGAKFMTFTTNGKGWEKSYYLN